MIDGRDVREYTLASLRGQFGVVLQESLLFAASIRENIGYGRPGASDEQIRAAARLANVDEFVSSLPDGYDTVVSERGVTLSGGQRQRIAIARAAVRDAPILLLDEPTTGLDEENRRGVIEALERVSAERTSVLITHDLQVASRADVIFYLDAGRVAESGSHEELMALGGRYAALFRLQSLGATTPTSPELREAAGDGGAGDASGIAVAKVL
jgi:ATP-binding cassette subfamily B protein